MCILHNPKIAQKSACKFVQFAYCKITSDMLYYNHSKGARQSLQTSSETRGVTESRTGTRRLAIGLERKYRTKAVAIVKPCTISRKSHKEAERFEGIVEPSSTHYYKELLNMYSRVIANELGEIEEYVSDLTGAEVEKILTEHPEWTIKCIPIEY